MIEAVANRETVAIDEAAHDIYKQLTEGSNLLSAPFRTMKDVFMWAVCLGVQQNKRRPLTGKKITIFRWTQFESQTDMPLLKAIAIADGGDVGVLLKRNDILTIAEEYANAGIFDLRDIMMEGKDLPLWNLVGLLDDNKL